MTKRFLVLCFCAMTAVLAACEPGPFPDRSDYWSRNNGKDSALMEGPKAQQMLYRDISRCAIEVSEIERLESIRDRVCEESDENEEDEEYEYDEDTMGDHIIPAKEKPIRTEHSHYKDFETCMQVRGWIRMENRPYDMRKSERSDYIDTITDQRYRSKIGECRTPEGDPCSSAVDDRGYVGYEDYVGYDKDKQR